MSASVTDVPSRIVVHVDLDCFYCQVEQKRLAIPRDQPCAVQQWDGLIAVNYAARKLGISKLSNLTEALQICPNLRCVHVEVLDEKGAIDEALVKAQASAPSAQLQFHGKASLARYRRASTEVFKVFRATLPSCVIEKASIDEAYVDLTDEVAKELDSCGAGGGMARAHQVLASVSQCSVVVGGQLLPGSDFDARLATAARLTSNLRAKVFETLDYTVSAGISHNKLLAKLASGMNKPNNQTVIPVSAVGSLMGDLALSKIRNFGGKLGHMLESLGCVTAADVQKLSHAQLEMAVGDNAAFVMKACRGVSDEEVTEKSVPKSMLAAKAFPVTKSWQPIEHWLKVLCGELAERMAEDSDLHNRRPKNLVVQYRRADGAGRFGAGTERSKSVQLHSSEVPSASELFDVAMGILRSLPELMPCNRLAISTNTFQPLPGSDGGLLDQMFSAPRQKPKPKGKPAGDAKTSQPAKSMSHPAKQPAQAVPHLAKQSVQAVPVPKSIVQAHVRHASGGPGPGTAAPSSSAYATATARSLPKPSQPAQSSKRTWDEHASASQPAKVVEAGGWVQRKQPKSASNAVPAHPTSGIGASSLLSTHYESTQGLAAPYVSTLAQGAQGTGTVAARGAQQGVDTSAAGRWMQWAQQAATEKNSLEGPYAAEQHVSGENHPVSDRKLTKAEPHSTGGGHMCVGTAHAPATQAVLDLTDEPDCNLGGVDVAEQRHILNLIQMSTPKAPGGNAAMSADASGKTKGSVRKQGSILSLLDKR